MSQRSKGFLTTDDQPSPRLRPGRGADKKTSYPQLLQRIAKIVARAQNCPSQSAGIGSERRPPELFSSYLTTICLYNVCMQQITVERVFEEESKAYRARRTQPAR